MDISREEYDRIAQEISSDESVVGIDAKKTHILILSLLSKMGEQLDQLESRLSDIEEKLSEK